jgi:hypothetical protein
VGWAFPADGRKPDLAAPGAAVLSALPGGGYAAWSGTSMAAPHLCGAAALMLQGNPDLDPAQLGDMLRGSCVDLGVAGYDHDFGHGRLDAHAAVTAALSPLSAELAPGDAVAAALAAYPNPFADRVRLDFAAARGGTPLVEIFDLQGRRLRSLVAAGARGSLFWDGRDAQGRSLPAGVYLARITAGESTATCRLLSLR